MATTNSTPRKTTTKAKATRKPVPLDAIGALHAVKAWRDEPRQGGFPHELRVQIDALCKQHPLPAAS